MTIHEIKNRTLDRFVICYSCRKMIYLKDLGFSYIFKCLNENSNTPFWVFDRTQKIIEALNGYQKPNNNDENNLY